MVDLKCVTYAQPIPLSRSNCYDLLSIMFYLYMYLFLLVIIATYCEYGLSVVYVYYSYLFDVRFTLDFTLSKKGRDRIVFWNIMIINKLNLFEKRNRGYENKHTMLTKQQ